VNAAKDFLGWHALFGQAHELKSPEHQRREIIVTVPLENCAFCTVFCANFHKF
jgi:hypothetical protein